MGFLAHQQASFLLGEVQTSINRTLPPLTKYSCRDQLKVLFPWWEDRRHLCVCSIFGERIVTSLLAAKHNIAAANNNIQFLTELVITSSVNLSSQRLWKAKGSWRRHGSKLTAVPPDHAAQCPGWVEDQAR